MLKFGTKLSLEKCISMYINWLEIDVWDIPNRNPRTAVIVHNYWSVPLGLSVNAHCQNCSLQTLKPINSPLSSTPIHKFHHYIHIPTAFVLKESVPPEKKQEKSSLNGASCQGLNPHGSSFFWGDEPSSGGWNHPLVRWFESWETSDGWSTYHPLTYPPEIRSSLKAYSPF